MGLSSLSPRVSAETGFTATILHPVTNVPFAPSITVTVLGTDSETFKRIQRKQLNRRLERSQKNRSKGIGFTAEESEAEGLELVVACVKAWHTGSRPELELDDGEWLPCTPDNIKKVFEALPWLKEQVDQEIGDRANFLGKSVTA